MSKFAAGNLLLATSIACATASHVMIKGLVDELGGAALSLAGIADQLTWVRALRGGIAATLLVAGFLCWVLCLTRLELSYAYPVASTSIVLVALFSVLALGETMTLRMWIGTLLILAGVVLVRPGQPG